MEYLIAGAITLNLYATLLILARALVYRTKLYRPMLWNIVLSIAPSIILALGFTVWVALSQTLGVTWLPITWAVLVVLAWLLMLPNASYLITELNLSHRRESDPVPLWYDIILVITLAMSGVANTVINVFIMQFVYATTRYGDTAAALTKPDTLWLTAAVMVLVGFGMYLGRYLRLNSWDLTHPWSVIRKLVAHFRIRENLWAGLGFTFTYALFLAIITFMMVAPFIGGLMRLEDTRNY